MCFMCSINITSYIMLWKKALAQIHKITGSVDQSDCLYFIWDNHIVQHNAPMKYDVTYELLPFCGLCSGLL